MKNLNELGALKKSLMLLVLALCLLAGAFIAFAYPPFPPNTADGVANLYFLATPTGTLTGTATPNIPVAVPVTVTHRVFQTTDNVAFNGAVTFSQTPVAVATPMAAVFTDVEGYLSNFGTANEKVYIAEGGVTEILQVPYSFPPIWFNFTASTKNKGVSIWTDGTSGATVIGPVDTRKR